MAREPQQSIGASLLQPPSLIHTPIGCLSPAQGSSQVALYCARRTTTASSWGFREQEGHLALPPSFPSERVHRATISPLENKSLQGRSLPLQGWGLIDLPLRASNEGLRRPRVARAQKIIRLHPLSFLACPSPHRTTELISPHPAHPSPLSEPLNFPQLSSSFFSSSRRHPSCSSIRPSADGADEQKGGEAKPKPT